MAGKGGGGKVAVIVLGCGCAAVGIIGVLAAIAIPAFMSYTRRAKTEEARANLALIFSGAASYHGQETFAGGSVITGRLPPHAARMPSVVPCGVKVVVDPAEQDAGWQALSFMPYDPVYYAYEWEAAEDGSQWVARAIGDMDCDGVHSVFELHGGVRGSELYREPEIRVENELE